MRKDQKASEKGPVFVWSAWAPSDSLAGKEVTAG